MKLSREPRVPAISPGEYDANTSSASRTKAKAKHQGCQQISSKWESKALHTKYPQWLKEADVNQDKPHCWLRAAGLNV